MEHNIIVKGARENNLKDVSVEIPAGQFTVITGVSGSGKSSLAFDTIYAEGQRRFVESLSSYARQYLGRMSKPKCDSIKGLPPAIAIEQKVISRNPRSTVGTSTEIYEYLRLLFARIGRTYSPVSGQEIRMHTAEDIRQCVEQYSEGTRFVILAPLKCSGGGSAEQLLGKLLQRGYSHVWHNGSLHYIEDIMTDGEVTAKGGTDDIFLMVDRMSRGIDSDFHSRLADSVETAMYEGDGSCRLVFLPSGITYDFSTRFEADGMKFEKPNDGMFAFNSPAGACPTCEGYGKTTGIDERLVIPNPSLSVYEGCVQCWHGEKLSMWKEEFCRRAVKDDFPIFTPYYSLSQDYKDMLWHGLKSEAGMDMSEKVCIDAFFGMVRENQYKIQYRVLQSRYTGKTICPQCHGRRLRKEALWVRIGGMSIADLVEMSVENLIKWFALLTLDAHEAMIADRLLTEIKTRLGFLSKIGLGYLTLNRASNTLSGGESQRINLANSLGSPLVGSIYVLDEPSIGLHSRDTSRLIDTLQDLTRLHNTVVVVEHDEDIMRAADHIIDIGPDAGRLGGEVVFEGNARDVTAESAALSRSHTMRYLTGAERIVPPAQRRAWSRTVGIKGARMNNLKGVNVDIPLNVMTVVTGVSGSGKSSLIKGILYPALKRRIDETAERPGEHSAITGYWNDVGHVESVDQNPIGKSTRSNPVTYVKAFDLIRQLYAAQPLAVQEGYTSQFFSFNADGGRCEECKGAGVITVEMQFMADLTIECESCKGMRYKKDILEVCFHGKNIHDVLEMTVEEAMRFFSEHGQTQIVSRLRPLYDVGLGYIKLGQSASTLSGGENQRVKMAYFIAQEKQVPTMFIFDEPTTGLHFHDIHVLLKSFDSLIDRGHTIVIIEHNMDVIKCADYVIDLGPDGGDRGGMLVCQGTPEQVAECRQGFTGKYLRQKLQQDGLLPDTMS